MKASDDCKEFFEDFNLLNETDSVNPVVAQTCLRSCESSVVDKLTNRYARRVYWEVLRNCFRNAQAPTVTPGGAPLPSTETFIDFSSECSCEQGDSECAQ